MALVTVSGELATEPLTSSVPPRTSITPEYVAELSASKRSTPANSFVNGPAPVNGASSRSVRSAEFTLIFPPDIPRVTPRFALSVAVMAPASIFCRLPPFRTM